MSHDSGLIRTLPPRSSASSPYYRNGLWLLWSDEAGLQVLGGGHGSQEQLGQVVAEGDDDHVLSDRFLAPPPQAHTGVMMS